MNHNNIQDQNSPQGGEGSFNKWGVEIIPHELVLNRLLNNIVKINYRELAEIEPGVQINNRHIVVVTIEQILKTAKENNWSIRLAGGQLAVYNGAYWKLLTKDEVKSFLGEAAIRLGNDPTNSKYHRFKDELYLQFLSSSFISKILNKSERILINFNNGTLEVRPKGEYVFREFRENDLLFYQLGFNYDPLANTNLFDKFLNKVLPNLEQQMILSEFLGYVFIRNSVLKLEKSLILYGNGANGKSTFFEIIYGLFGKENISTFSLQNLTNETGYFRAKIVDKLLNYASEISSKMDSSVFKALASGEPVEARLPYGEPFQMEDYAKLMFNTNELPRDVENNTAFFRRFIILEFAQTIPENERDPKLASKIKETELPGIFNWIIQGLNRIISQQGFTKSILADKALENYKLQSDSVYLFISESDIEPGNNEIYSLQDLYLKYKTFAYLNGYKYCSNKKMKDRLTNYGFQFDRRSNGWCVWLK